MSACEVICPIDHGSTTTLILCLVIPTVLSIALCIAL